MNKITPCLWFDRNAEEAAKFYVSVFKNGKIGQITYYEQDKNPSNLPKGTVMTVSFELFGQKYLGLNGGPIFPFTEAVSLMVNCDTQAEIDEYWAKLTADGGKESVCGWLKDKFGLSWQIVPSILPELMASPHSDRVMQEVLKMVKLDIATLKRAADGQ
jgi:predicted 3-demethylubiquinone-9 3-methyltransferase (glyoxalase superfamily)